MKEVEFDDPKNAFQMAKVHSLCSRLLRADCLCGCGSHVWRSLADAIPGILQSLSALAHFPLGVRDPVLHGACFCLENRNQYRKGPVLFQSKCQIAQMDLHFIGHGCCFLFRGKRPFASAEYEPSGRGACVPGDRICRRCLCRCIRSIVLFRKKSSCIAGTERLDNIGRIQWTEKSFLT